MADFSKIVNFDGGIKGVVDDGTQAIPIENKFGKKICTIYVRPGDLSIIDRYNEVEKRLPAIVEPLKDMGIKNDGTAEFEKDWNILKEVEASLYKELNYLFDMDEAAEIFATRNPFSSVNGTFFCEIIIEVIGDIIANGVQAESEQVQRRTEKYLDDLKPEVNADAGRITDFPTNSGERV